MSMPKSVLRPSRVRSRVDPQPFGLTSILRYRVTVASEASNRCPRDGECDDRPEPCRPNCRGRLHTAGPGGLLAPERVRRPRLRSPRGRCAPRRPTANPHPPRSRARSRGQGQCVGGRGEGLLRVPRLRDRVGSRLGRARHHRTAGAGATLEGIEWIARAAGRPGVTDGLADRRGRRGRPGSTSRPCAITSAGPRRRLPSAATPVSASTTRRMFARPDHQGRPAARVHPRRDPGDVRPLRSPASHRGTPHPSPGEGCRDRRSHRLVAGHARRPDSGRGR